MAQGAAHHEASQRYIRLHKGVPVNSGYTTPSRLVRVIAVLAASVLTGTLFTAVAFGLTGDGGWSLFSHYDAAQAGVRPA